MSGLFIEVISVLYCQSGKGPNLKKKMHIRGCLKLHARLFVLYACFYELCMHAFMCCACTYVHACLRTWLNNSWDQSLPFLGHPVASTPFFISPHMLFNNDKSQIYSYILDRWILHFGAGGSGLRVLFIVWSLPRKGVAFRWLAGVIPIIGISTSPNLRP